MTHASSARPRRRRSARWLIAAFSAFLTLTGCGVLDPQARIPDDWTPRGSVKMVVAFSPGGGSDRSARVMAQALNDADAGFNVNVQNKDGGSGAVGWSSYLAEEGNGNSLLVAETALNTLPIVYDTPFTYKSFTPLMMFAQDSRIVVAPKDSPFNSCADIVAAAKSRRVVAGVSGKTGADNVVLAQLNDAGRQNGSTKKIDSVPYSSTGEVLTGLLAGQVAFAPASAASAKPFLESGDFKGLCSASTERIDDPVIGKIPTAEEEGLDVEVTVWRGVFAPAGIAEVQRRYWLQALDRAVTTKTYDDYIAQDLLVPEHVSGQKFGAYLDRYDIQMRKVFG